MDPFQEIKPALAIDEALSESNRCLMCFDAPCIRACPTHIDVPAFIKKIATGNLRGSARTILQANILGASCARVCPTEVLCEGACVLNDVHHKPIKIGQLQRFATDGWMARGPDSLKQLFALPPLAQDAPRVAIIGAGPAGLSCAAELLSLGVKPIVFDAAAKPGGLNTYGVADYKITPDFALKEVAWVCALGIEVRSGITVPDQVSIADLERDFKAIFIGVGLGRVSALGIPGEGLDGVLDALDFIAHLKLDREGARARLVGKRVVVIGGGNTAIDAVTQAARLGASEVSLVYRRGQADMPAYLHEQELAHQAGCRLLLEAAPTAIHGKTRVERISLIKVASMEKGRGGALEPIPGSEFDLACDFVIKANGQTPRTALLASLPGVLLNKGRPVVDASLQTTNPRYFAGGDCISGGKEVVNAVAEGKLAARSIHRLLFATAKETI